MGKYGPRSTRRVILAAAVAGGAIAGSPMAAAMSGAVPPASPPLQGLARALRTLSQRAGDIDYNDPTSARAYYAASDQVMAELIRTPAQSWAGLQVKAEAVAWCCASRVDFALGDTVGERLIASILQDLLAGGQAA